MMQTKTSLACEYFQSFETPTTPGHAGPRVKQSSSDPLLTALASLGAHRLKAKRGLITLSTKDTEFILAEAGTGLRLQQDDDENDPLWHGVGPLQVNIGLGMQLCKLFCTTGNDSLVVNDLTQHPTYKENACVKDGPMLRFLACVPLRSPLHNFIIGCYIVVDDKPRNGLSLDDLDFLKDLGVTCMDHLEAQRNNRKQYRSERMLKAVSLFIEGKSTLREWWLQTAARKRVRNGTTSILEKQADIEFGVQEAIEPYSRRDIFNDYDVNLSRSPSPSSLSHPDQKGDGRPPIPSRTSEFSTSDTTMSTLRSAVFSEEPSTASVTTVDETVSSSHHVKHSSVAFDMPPENSIDVSKELQEALLTKDLKAVFSRASNLIREAGSVDGVVFLDAAIGSFGGANEKDVMKAPGNFHIDDATTTDDDGLRKASDTDGSATRHTEETNPTENCCSILGFSTRNRSSLKGHMPQAEHHTFPERVLRILLKRYPHGKVFNFEDDGSFSSSDTDNAYMGCNSGPKRHPRSETNERRRNVTREAEAAALLTCLPGARSIFFYPLWDVSRERWYSGSLVWTASSTRTLCPIEDLTYLAAFGNSIMAEVARLSALVITQMKTDFISSVSHELRSPLQAVLASVEFLQDTILTEVQEDMVNNIGASGRTLRDTIDHVLDYSKVNQMVKTKGKISRKKMGDKRISFHDNGNLDGALNDAESGVNLCVLTEEVVESVWAGRHPGSKHASLPVEVRVTVIFDIEKHTSWNFDIDAGAWRRILLNLFGNSAKYTQRGFIKVSLAVHEDGVIKGRKARSTLVLKVKDSGKGISQDFLKNSLFKPFTQEDSLAVGTGLGLSIVRHIIQDLGGEINFTSEQGVGTEATVKLPLLATPPAKSIAPDIVKEVRSVTQGKTFHLEGFDRYPDLSQPATGILSRADEAAMFSKSSVHFIATKWFGMRATSAAETHSDVVFLVESDLDSMQKQLQAYQASGVSVAVVLSNSYPNHSTWSSTAYGNFKILHVHQPYGPHKLARAFHHSFTAPNTLINPTMPKDAQPQNHPPFQVVQPRPRAEIIFAFSTQAVTPAQKSDVLDRRTSIDTTVIRPSEGGMRVLLVEDNEINMKLLVAYMRKLKLNHTTAINGLEALNAYKEAAGAFDVIFMDISMPIMDGIQSARHIRLYERENVLPPVALIALTGAANPTTRQEAFASGVDLYLTKPIAMKSLKSMLEDLRRDGREGFGVAAA
ncbi:hypothetical protein BLS_006882 [Venturia inaequalis]|uniref:histidine kinase n=1 Tax=Venturia inaequalis TaxID=5025 RepID=A0A8H3UDC3_VENIN|nr:hypothetical protein BLS_006882 [Venturia inaequalis]